MLRINDTQKHEVWYTRELYDVIINANVSKTLIFVKLYFEAVSAVKLLQYVIANLNLKGYNLLFHP